MNAERKPEPTRREVGKPLFDAKDMPPGIKAAGEAKLPEGAKVVPAREGGGYKGKVIYANDHYVVQAVGAKQENAVVHRKEDVQMMGQKLEWREKNGMLNNVSIQVHYNGDKAKAYVWNQEREQQARAEQAQSQQGGVKQAEKAATPDLHKAPMSKQEAIDRIGLRLNADKEAHKAAGIPDGHTLTALRGKPRTEAEDRMSQRKEAKDSGDAEWLKQIDSQVKDRNPVAVKQRAGKAAPAAELER